MANGTPLYPGVTVGIVDSTTWSGIQPAVRSIVAAMGRAAQSLGLTLQITAGAGEAGHVSHYDGTEVDLVGYTAAGTPWTQDQRLSIAEAARAAGATRFGLYTGASGTFTGNALHIGTGPGGNTTPAVWGYSGLTSGDASRRFTDPGEAAFAATITEGGTVAASLFDTVQAELTGGATAPTAGGQTTIGLDPALAAAGGNWFLRGVIIILGFIFVGVGLSMFRDKAVVVLQEAVKA